MQDTLPIARIVQGKNPREYFDPQEMTELKDGIRAYGVLQPILVRPISGSDLYEIVAGERRWRAAKNVFGDDYDSKRYGIDVWTGIDGDSTVVPATYFGGDYFGDRGDIEGP